MSRCKCGELLSDTDLRLFKSDGSPEDLCSECRRWAFDTSEIEKEYMHEKVVEGLKSAYYVK